ncbi:unnamed protein product [Schistocephalus solidus]|uniref:Glyco_hydro_36C domain-containing protein n=1 Tax=Schistocephalus solidus TaxID=70667 RepID=A0A183TAI2_SCHSO|nr:unnamed protein product [Schistocephalus solidus]
MLESASSSNSPFIIASVYPYQNWDKRWRWKGMQIYAGYVDDPRNTDNAWMETVAVNFHDEIGTGLALFPLEAGDDATAVRWTDVSSQLELYANHRYFLRLTAELHGAHW